MGISSPRSGVLAAIFGLFLYASAAWAQCSSYSVEIIAGPPCKHVPATAIVQGINEAGACCGGYTSCSGLGHPTVWTPESGVSNIQLPPGFVGGGCRAVNAAGQTAGYMGNPNLIPPDRGFFSDNGVAINIGTLPGDTWSQAIAINDSGVVCGDSNNPATGPLRAFVWQDGKMSSLNLSYGVWSQAKGISNTGRICGWMGSDISNDAHAFIYDLNTRTTVDIGVPIPDAASATALGISQNGNIVCGWGAIPCGRACYTLRGFVWSNGIAEDLGLWPDYTRVFPFDVNNSGVVVGYSDQFPEGFARAFVWYNGVMTALNDLIPSDAELDISEAYSINNAGQIAAVAQRLDGSSDVVGVRLTPIPSMHGDYNCDRIVNTVDLLGVINHWNITGNNPADVNHDGVVNASDLVVVIQNWTQ